MQAFPSMERLLQLNELLDMNSNVNWLQRRQSPNS